MGARHHTHQPTRRPLAVPLTVLDDAAVRRWAFRARSALLAHRDRLDDLNVFPVPDGDTGTNLYLTLNAALESMSHSLDTRPLGDLVTDTSELARSTLLAARGNSGVILSQLVRGLAEAISEAFARPATGPDRRPDRRPTMAQTLSPRVGSGVGSGAGAIDGRMLAGALRTASERARQAVHQPVEGTILTVADAAAAEAGRFDLGDDLVDVVARAVEGAQDALARTPSQLPLLADAGVVDAGGAGFLLMLRTLHGVVAGDDSLSLEAQAEDVGRDRRRPSHRVAHRCAVAGEEAPRPTPREGDESAGEGHPAYEIMFLLADAPDAAADLLVTHLHTLGDSIVVAGDRSLRSVHVHADDSRAAVSAGMNAGRVTDVRVTVLEDVPLARSVPEPHARLYTPMTPMRPVSAKKPTTRAALMAAMAMPPAIAPAMAMPPAMALRVARAASRVVRTAAIACVAEPGLREVFRAEGATLVPTPVGERPTPAQILDAIRGAAAPSVVILADDPDVELACRAAASVAATEGIDATVLPTRTSLAGLAALSVHDDAADPEAALSRMREAADAVRTGSIVIAARATRTPVGWCEAGQSLGYVEDTPSVIGDHPTDVALRLMDRLLAPTSEIVTLVRGLEAPTVARHVAERLRLTHPHLDLVEIDGGQRVRALLVGVE